MGKKRPPLGGGRASKNAEWGADGVARNEKNQGMGGKDQQGKEKKLGVGSDYKRSLDLLQGQRFSRRKNCQKSKMKGKKKRRRWLCTWKTKAAGSMTYAKNSV